MGKSTHFIGQPVYNQVIKLLDKQQIKQISLETPRSEAYVKRLDGWTHLVIMLFGVLKHFDSLREVEIGMKAEVNKLHHLGIDYVVRRSTLADANKRRPQEFFASVYAYLLERYGVIRKACQVLNWLPIIFHNRISIEIISVLYQWIISLFTCLCGVGRKVASHATNSKQRK